MRPRIISCHNIGRSIRYNEQKVLLGSAQCLTAFNFLKPASHISVEEKLHVFERRMALNDRATTNLHLTLNFDPLDKLNNDQMRKICRVYMREIGFEEQPYLVYRHTDAGHPHCHIVTTHIRSDGNPIDLYMIGARASEKARLQIEKDFGLVTKEMKQQLRHQQQHEFDGVGRIIYGQHSIAKSMSRVLEHVTRNYCYTSIDEFNAILGCYNLEAYRGKEGTKLFESRGLLYRVLDENNRYIGVPLKASFFDCKPTLANLEQQFQLNLPQKFRHLSDTRASIQWELLQKPDSISELKNALSANRIQLIMEKEKGGIIGDVTYIDYKRKCVFQGQDLGKDYSLERIKQLTGQPHQHQHEYEHQQRLSIHR